jgi:hypothetical protein
VALLACNQPRLPSSSSHRFGAGTRAPPPGYHAAAWQSPGRFGADPPGKDDTLVVPPLVPGPEALEYRSRGVQTAVAPRHPYGIIRASEALE